MVTKHCICNKKGITSLILAKNHMVTKRLSILLCISFCLILAKNHMVTKHSIKRLEMVMCLILAKNHMVTKQVLCVAY